MRMKSTRWQAYADWRKLESFLPTLSILVKGMVLSYANATSTPIFSHRWKLHSQHGFRLVIQSRLNGVILDSLGLIWSPVSSVAMKLVLYLSALSKRRILLSK